MWTDLVKAYESKISVLEEARRAYLGAVGNMVNEVGQALETAVRKNTALSAAGYCTQFLGTQSSDDATFSGAPFTSASIVDEADASEFRINSWVASCFGGPNSTLRVAVTLDRVRPGLDLKEWILKCSDAFPDSAPGAPFTPQEFLDVPSDRPVVRIVSLSLVDRAVREVAEESRQMAQTLMDHIVPMLARIRDAGLAMVVAEQALLEYRPVLEAKAERAGAQVAPKQGLGMWQGGKYLQVGDFWIRALPASNELLVECNQNDEVVVAELGQRLGRQMARRDGHPYIVLMKEGQLRDSKHDAKSAIATAFECWFEVMGLDTVPRTG